MLAFGALVLGVAGLGWGQEASPSEGEDKPLTSLSLQTFDEVWGTIHDSYYDPSFGGLDWKGLRETYRPKAAEAKSPAALRPILNEMIGKLGQSHFGVIPGSADLEETALIEASKSNHESEGDDSRSDSSESDDEKVDAQEDEPKGQTDTEVEAESGDYSGLHLRLKDDLVVISRVDKASPAAKAGLKAGQRVVRIGDLEVKAFQEKAAAAASQSFSQDFFILQVLGELTGSVGAGGERQSLTVTGPKGGRRSQTIAYRPIKYPGKMSAKVANMPSVPIRFEHRQLDLPQGAVCYVRFNIFLPELMGKLRSAIKGAAKEGNVGLIVDLRGNPGGIGMMANGLAGLLTETQFSLGQMTMRAGTINFVAFPQKGAFTNPMVILVDAMSASTSEIFAAGLQEAGRARIIGRRSMGAALPSFIRVLPNGDRLQHAIANLTTAGGTRVEGRGVIPDDPVPLRLGKLYQGSDPDLEKALKWIQRQSKGKAKREKKKAS